METRKATPAAHAGDKPKTIPGYYTPEVLEDIKTSMLDAGIDPPEEIIIDGELHRYTQPDKVKANSFYKFYPDGKPAGYFGDYAILGEDEIVKWSFKGKLPKLLPLELKLLQEKAASDKLKRSEETLHKHKMAAAKARDIVKRAKPASKSHPYLRRKKINPHGALTVKHLVKGSSSNYIQRLVIPLRNSANQIVNVQFIDEDGTKRFLAGGELKGCFHRIGKLDSSPKGRVGICEGFATGASLHEMFGGICIFAALSSGNMAYVAAMLRQMLPDTELIIFGDRDVSGVGEKAARKAAIAGKCKYLLPKQLGDFNDQWVEVQNGRV